MEPPQTKIVIRQVPELRIKLLDSEHHYPDMIPQESAVRMFFDTMGMEIANKMFEFHKYKIERHDGEMIIKSHIEVIVPTTEEINAKP